MSSNRGRGISGYRPVNSQVLSSTDDSEENSDDEIYHLGWRKIDPTSNI